MVIVGADTETTGFDFDRGDRIVEVCFGIYHATAAGLEHLRTINQRINPERAIPAEAQRVHGISLEDLKTSPTWSGFAPTVQRILDRADMLVIHNAEFDVPFLQGEQARAGYPVSRPLDAFCTMRNGLWATFDGKSPTLKELCWSLGIKYDPTAAHAASYDVEVMMQAYWRGVQLGLYPNPIK